MILSDSLFQQRGATTPRGQVPLASAIMDDAEALSRSTQGTTEAIWPASILQGRMALLLSPKSLKEVEEGKAFLVLNSVLGHLTVLPEFTSTALRARWCCVQGVRSFVADQEIHSIVFWQLSTRRNGSSGAQRTTLETIRAHANRRGDGTAPSRGSTTGGPLTGEGPERALTLI